MKGAIHLKQIFCPQHGFVFDSAGRHCWDFRRTLVTQALRVASHLALGRSRDELNCYLIKCLHTDTDNRIRLKLSSARFLSNGVFLPFIITI